MRKTKAEALKTREDLLLSALDTFYDRGVGRASLNEIAQNAGVTRGALYWHFKNKEDLFDALFQHIFNQVNADLQNDILTDSPDLWDNFHCCLLNMFERIQNNENHRKFFNILHLKCEHTEQNEAIIKLMTSYTEMWDTMLTSTLSACVKQKVLPPDLDIPSAVLFVQSNVTGLIRLWLARPTQFDLISTAQRQVSTCLGALQYAPPLRKAD